MLENGDNLEDRDNKEEEEEQEEHEEEETGGGSHDDGISRDEISDTPVLIDLPETHLQVEGVSEEDGATHEGSGVAEIKENRSSPYQACDRLATLVHTTISQRDRACMSLTGRDSACRDKGDRQRVREARARGDAMALHRSQVEADLTERPNERTRERTTGKRNDERRIEGTKTNDIQGLTNHSAEAMPSSTIKLAVLFGYNGSGFRGFERSNHGKTVEGEILNALAKLTGQNDPSRKVTLINISRSSATEEGEHAARQVVSFEISVYFMSLCVSGGGVVVGRTYVFSPPLPQTGYAHAFQPDMTREELDLLYPDPAAGPTGRLFTTIKRNKRRSMVSSNRSMGHGSSAQLSSSPPSAPDVATGEDRGDLPSPPASPIEAATSFVTAGTVQPESGANTGGVGHRRLSKFMGSMIRGSNSNSPIAISRSPPADPSTSSFFSTSPTSTSPTPPSTKSSRRRSQYGVRSQSAPAPSSRAEERRSLLVDPVDNDENDEPPSSSALSNFLVSKRRQQSPIRTSIIAAAESYVDPRFAASSSRKDPFQDDDDEDNPAPAYYDPLDLPLPTEEMMSVKRKYRMTKDGMRMLKYILGMFRGTHNFWNFVPGACGDPEVHFGMEWIRIKIQSKAFARYQIRRMIALAIQVIRTNTPRNAVSNAFGIHPISIPEAPALGLIFDEPFYMAYNKSVERDMRIGFEEVRERVEDFRKKCIHDAVYREEMEFMQFVRNPNEEDDDAILRAKPVIVVN
ncbi:hypothetical protein BC829DRAFT_441701 [Chytridium lagenaria]|nr:hypothetical protein BC829DRAFT_441701 [Chytridium lagenaria]